jgi:competence protein ComEC
MESRWKYTALAASIVYLCLSLGVHAQSLGGSASERVEKLGSPAKEAVLTVPVVPTPQTEGLLKVHFLDVGHGDACLIQCPDGENILIDAGSGEYSYFVTDYLRNAGVKELDMVIATHPHSDHVGGLSAVINEFPVKLVLDPGKAHTTGSYRQFLEAVKAHPDTEYKIGRAGQKYTFGKVKLSILHPGNRLPRKINNCSIVSRLEYDKISFLFAGDAQKEAEEQILRRRYRLKSTVLKVGHHGSTTSTTKPFLRAVSPRVAVISTGPSPPGYDKRAEIVDRLEKRGVKVYRTDRDGTIKIESNGKNCTIKRVKRRG